MNKKAFIGILLSATLLFTGCTGGIQGKNLTRAIRQSRDRRMSKSLRKKIGISRQKR